MFFKVIFDLWKEEQNSKIYLDIEISDEIDERQLDENWINEINNEFIPIAEKNNREYYKKYNSLPKNKLSSKKSRAIRDRKIRNFLILEEEKELIKNFYMDCPKGYDVDHIIPLSKGGQHSMKNMQWLPKSLNRRKSYKIIPPLSDYPHCRIDLENFI